MSTTFVLHILHEVWDNSAEPANISNREHNVFIGLEQMVVSTLI